MDCHGILVKALKCVGQSEMFRHLVGELSCNLVQIFMVFVNFGGPKFSSPSDQILNLFNILVYCIYPKVRLPLQ